MDNKINCSFPVNSIPARIIQPPNYPDCTADFRRPGLSVLGLGDMVLVFFFFIHFNGEGGERGREEKAVEPSESILVGWLSSPVMVLSPAGGPFMRCQLGKGSCVEPRVSWKQWPQWGPCISASALGRKLATVAALSI